MTRHCTVLTGLLTGGLILGLGLAGPALAQSTPSPHTVGTGVAPE